ncbi:MAG TPA: iron ABC transporter permease [Micromonosporaceae bacterium]|nr:iron ABC transporter permease [Micromonosporaceae bacterium]
MKTLQYRLATLRSNPMPILAIALAAVLVYAILGPVESVLSAAFVAHAGDPGVTQLPGHGTTFYLERMFSSRAADRLFYQPLWHSIELTALTAALTIALGVGAGWLAARTDVWGGVRWNGILIVAFMVPSWAFAQTWLTIFKNEHAAGGTGVLQSLGVRVPDALAYGLIPSVIVLSLHLFPLVMALSIDAFGRIDAAQEEAAVLLGASRLTVVRRIMLPGIRPTVLSAAMLIAAGVMGDFGAPYVLGLPVGYNVLATSLYGELKNNRQGTAAVLATVVTLLGVLLIAGDSSLTRGAKRFQTLTGGTMRLQPIRLRFARPFAFALLVILAIVAFAGPLLILAGSTFVDKLGHVSLADLTTRYWWQGTGNRDFPTGLLRSADFWIGLRNTAAVAALAAIVCAIVGLVAAVLIRNSPGWIGSLLRQLTFLPHLVPGVALAAGLIALFVVPRGPIPALYGTFTLIIIGMVISHLPFATRTGIAAVSQFGGELDDAARMSGAGWLSTLRRVTVPLLRRTFGAAALFPFISGLKELTLIVMLSTISMQFLPALSLDLSEHGYTQQANAVTTVITLLAVAGGILARRLGGMGAALAT